MLEADGEYADSRPFWATGPLAFENPATIVQGDRVTHLVYDVSR